LPVLQEGAPRRRSALLLVISGGFAVLCLLAAGIYVIPRRQAGVSGGAHKSDANRVKLDEVYVDVTYATPELLHRVKLDAFAEQYGHRAQGFLVGINTHVGDIHACHFAGTLKLVDSNGHEYPSLGQPVVVSHHHNLWVAFFPRLDDYGKPIFDDARHHFTIRADGIGGIARRELTFELPVVSDQADSLLHKLGLWLAVLGAMLVVLSPCAVELTAYYTAIIAGSLGSASALDRASGSERRRVLACLLAFAGGFTLLYSLSGATIGLIGQRVDGQIEVFGPYKHVLQWIGAVLVGYFGLRVLGVFELGLLERTLGRAMTRLRAALRAATARLVRAISDGPAPILDLPAPGQKPARVTPLGSFFLGIGLSVGCLTCMGGAVIYPLMIFAGTSRWYWGGLTLLLYSAGIAIPMLLITLGLRDLRPRLTRRVALGRVLQGASGTLLVVIAFLLAADRERALFDPVFRLLARMGM
jgi:cytochrome c biogenesis protein CcdA